HVRPQVSDLRDTGGHRPQREGSRPYGAPLELLPRARCGHRRARPGTHRIRHGERRAVAVAPGVDENAPAAVRLAELLREALRTARDEHRAGGVCEFGDIAEGGRAVQWNGDV